MAETTKTLADIKKLAKDGKLIIGKEKTLAMLKSAGVAEVYLASNCPEHIRKDVSYYAEFAGVPVGTLDLPSDELGVSLKKSFAITVCSLPKGG
ncbi:TPA: 50S ribosomal protein L30 [Candidatus Woesearchaeota archaeon]|nr:50S ribosomal protein L30 [Candidatus Woesearchaeota archaeon]HII68586.1 50S ribosomal protein L30 [Candidatus Woesearchaeota archaeon]